MENNNENVLTRATKAHYDKRILENGTAVFYIEGRGPFTFKKTSYSIDGSTAVLVYGVDENGTVDSYYEDVLTVNLSDYGCILPDNIVAVHHDILSSAKDLLDVFIMEYCEDKVAPIRYGFASSIAVIIKDLDEIPSAEE